MSEKNRFDLEQEIMDCWQVVNAVEDLYKHIESMDGMNPKYQDFLQNYLLGLSTIYEVKFQRTFDTFEKCVKGEEV